MSDTREVTITGVFPAEMNHDQAEMLLALATLDARFNEIDLRTLRHHLRARTEVQRARSAVSSALKELSLIEVADDREDTPAGD